MGELDPATRQGQDPALTFDRTNRGEAAVLAVAAALTAGATATAATMAEATPAYANVPALSAPLVPGQENQQSPLFAERYPYGNPNPTAEASTSTATNPPDATSRQECINDALAPIDVVKTWLRRPRHDNPRTQKAVAVVKTERLPSNCGDGSSDSLNVVRHEYFAFKVGGVPFLADNLNVNVAYPDSNGKINHVLRLPGGPYNPPPTKWQLTRGIYKCTPGPKKTPVELLIKEVAVDPQTYGVTNYDTLGQKTFKPIPVTHILPHAC